MALDRTNPKSLARYREYQREYQREYGRENYKYNKEHKKKYYLFKKISVVFRNILLENEEK